MQAVSNNYHHAGLISLISSAELISLGYWWKTLQAMSMCVVLILVYYIFIIVTLLFSLCLNKNAKIIFLIFTVSQKDNAVQLDVDNQSKHTAGPNSALRSSKETTLYIGGLRGKQSRQYVLPYHRI